jgi:CDP-glucose 4,6-dehydratase
MHGYQKRTNVAKEFMEKWQCSMEITMNNMFWKNKRVLVTGYEGFLGSHLTKSLIKKGADVIGIDIIHKRPRSILTSEGLHNLMKCIKGDVCNLTLIRHTIKQYKPKVIFHLAAQAIVIKANNNPIKTFKSNIQGTWNILEACRDNKDIECLIIASSDKAYGTQKTLPYTEKMPLYGEHPYDVSKSCADLLAIAYYHTYKIPVCVTRCGNIYGPGDLNFSRIVPDAITSLIKGKKLTIRSDGKFTRDYVYVEDIVNGYLMLAEKIKSMRLYGEAFNFSNEKPISVLGLFESIASVYEKKAVKPKILNKAKYEIKHQYLSAKKARRVLNWSPKYTLKDGLRETLGWYKDNLE